MTVAVLGPKSETGCRVAGPSGEPSSSVLGIEHINDIYFPNVDPLHTEDTRISDGASYTVEAVHKLGTSKLDIDAYGTSPKGADLIHNPDPPLEYTIEGRPFDPLGNRTSDEASTLRRPVKTPGHSAGDKSMAHPTLDDARSCRSSTVGSHDT